MTWNSFQFLKFFKLFLASQPSHMLFHLFCIGFTDQLPSPPLSIIHAELRHHAPSLPQASRVTLLTMQ